MTGGHHAALLAHLVRDDGQEDVCFALYIPSTGRHRRTALVTRAILPEPGERTVAGTAWIEPAYALRAARVAAAADAGLAFVHSHPDARGWQPANDGSADAETERKLANLTKAMTGYPLAGLTLSTGSEAWSARLWDRGAGPNVARTDADTVRVLGSRLRVTYHPSLRPAQPAQPTQLRTVHSWGDEAHAHLARLRVLVVGGGSVGQLIVEMLARSGIESIGVMDFDIVEPVNLDRLHGATALDAARRLSKVQLARRTATQAATAPNFRFDGYEISVCEPEGLRAALDFDVIFSCVDRPWPRHVLNTIAYADVIPVADGGVRMERGDGGGLRNAYWRAHIAGASRPCLRCLGQYNIADVQLDRDGSLDDPTYMAGLTDDHPLRTRQNVYAASMAAASAMTNQFLSLTIGTGGQGDPGPLRYNLRTQLGTPSPETCPDDCAYRSTGPVGDARIPTTGPHLKAPTLTGGDHGTNRRPALRRLLIAAWRKIRTGR